MQSKKIDTCFSITKATMTQPPSVRTTGIESSSIVRNTRIKTGMLIGLTVCRPRYKPARPLATLKSSQQH